MSEKDIGFDWRSITPEDSPQTPMDVMADARHQALATASLKQGDRAFDFTRTLHDFTSSQERSTNVEFNLLDSAREKPVALIFGSYT